MNNSTNAPNMSGTGYLIIRASTARGAIPLQNARVTVRGTGENSGVIYSLVTDASGLTEKISLPAPPRSESESPSQILPYALYTVDVFSRGYYDTFFSEVAVFDSITAIQNAVLIPLADNEYSDSFTLNESINPSDRNSQDAPRGVM